MLLFIIYSSITQKCMDRRAILKVRICIRFVGKWPLWYVWIILLYNYNNNKLDDRNRSIVCSLLRYPILSMSIMIIAHIVFSARFFAKLKNKTLYT